MDFLEAIYYDIIPSQTGQHSPGTLRGWRHGVRQNEAWHLDWPSRQIQVVQSSSIQVSLSDIFLPDGLTQPLISVLRLRRRRERDRRNGNGVASVKWAET
ncbi:Uncharacterized protein APZ42_012116 [Daphnia magna]|uniref:Uncharacterized protein n=1 Tax=Daphnia magna TaxID=35525 RepID=A0A162S2V8_9CRUS|nr:Uncharacterized protein APZ42_012116 [Daphnia magna]